MSRRSRVQSESGYYHVVSRGIGKQILFEEEEDYQRYLETLRRFIAETSVTLIAYCLMENHVHLLVHTDEGLARAMKQIAERNILKWKNRGKFGEKEEKGFTFCGILFSDFEKRRTFSHF